MFSKQLKQHINTNKNITIRELLDLLGANSFFYFLFILTFFTSIPSPSWGLGTSTVPGGLLTIIISLQILLGFKHIYLPEFIQKRKIKTKFLKIAEKYGDKLKSNNQSNLNFFKNVILEKISAIFTFFCGILMMVPLILTNWAPSFAVTFISISHIFKNKWLLILCYILTSIMIVGYIYFFKLIIYFAKKFLKKLNINIK